MDREKWFWKGEGQLWKKLVVRYSNGKIDGILMDPQPNWIQDKFIDLSFAETLDDAILTLKREDFETYVELTLEADEG